MCKHPVSKYPEVRISIIIPDLLDVYQSIIDLVDDMKREYGDIFVYDKRQDKDVIIIVSDRELAENEIDDYIIDIMEYHQGIGEDLTEEEMIVRDQEVNEKWFNGNFNFWVLREREV